MSEPITPEQQRRSTLWNILRRVYIRVQAKAEGRRPETYSPHDEDMILMPWDRAMKHDLAQLSEVMEQARQAGIADALATFRRMDTAPDDLIDDAIEHASRQAHEEASGLPPESDR